MGLIKADHETKCCLETHFMDTFLVPSGRAKEISEPLDNMGLFQRDNEMMERGIRKVFFWCSHSKWPISLMCNEVSWPLDNMGLNLFTRWPTSCRCCESDSWKKSENDPFFGLHVSMHSSQTNWTQFSPFTPLHLASRRRLGVGFVSTKVTRTGLTNEQEESVNKRGKRKLLERRTDGRARSRIKIMYLYTRERERKKNV